MYARELTPDVIDKTITWLNKLDSSKTKVKVKQVNSYNAIAEISSGPTLDIIYSPAAHTIEGSLDEQNKPYIQIFINNYRVRYRQASHAIKREIMLVLNAIAGIIQAADSQYKLVVDFDKQKNPYFELFIIAEQVAQLTTN